MSRGSRTDPGLYFITGTDTAVGKSTLTGLLLAYLRARGVRALAMKPVCSGGRGDGRLLHRLQSADVTLDEVNPFWFRAPLAPALAARQEGRAVSLQAVLKGVKRLRRRCDVLLVEGAGGLLSPLGVKFSSMDLIKELRCRVILVAPNKLGTINSVLLHVGRLGADGVVPEVVLTHRLGLHSSAQCRKLNLQFLSDNVGKTRLFSLGLPAFAQARHFAIVAGKKKVKKTLASILGLN